MSKSSAVQEIILTVGVLVAVGIALVQLKGVLVGETQIAQSEIIYSFGRDLESLVDKAIANTGDAAFVYVPSIKSYTVDITKNTITIFDKISQKSIQITKS